MNTNDDFTEIQRLKTLLEYSILDTAYEEDFNDLVKLIAIICDVPFALISMIDDKRQWHKAKIGVETRETPRNETICQHTILQDGLLEIEDTIADERINKIPSVKAEDGIRFYAGLPLKAYNGHNIGSVCVVDTKPNKLSEKQKEALKLLTKQAMALVEAKRKNKNLGGEVESMLNSKINLAEAKLAKKEEDYNALMKAIQLSNAVLEFDTNSIILSANKRFLKLFGYKKSELIGESYTRILPKDTDEDFKSFLKKLKKGEFKSGRFKRLHKANQPIYIQASYNPIKNENGKVTKIVKIAQDITNEVLAEEALQEAKNEAEELNLQKDRFIANVSHEIRTPIHAVLGFTDILIDQNKNESLTDYLEAVKNAGEKLLFIVNDILDLSKIESGKIELDSEAFELEKLLKKVHSIFELKAKNHQIDFNFTIDQETPQFIIGDKNRLSQILINLIGNALKFTKKGSVHTFVKLISKTTQAAKIAFVIRDTGIGINPDKFEKIFERFEQAESNTTRDFGGTGLGLNITKQLVELHGGNIQLTSKVGEGTEFTFQIMYPIANHEEVSLKDANDAEILAKSLRILICEDNELNQKLVESLLQKNNIKFKIAQNGQEGVEILRKQKFDLIFMDLQMPVRDGYSATQFIRKELQLTTPIIALTANFMNIEKEKCLAAGMNDYLSKPFNKTDFFSKINLWTNSKLLVQNKQNGISKLTQTDLDFGFLEELLDGNVDYQKEMLNTFIEQADDSLLLLKKASAEGDADTIKKTAHKLKTSFGMLKGDTLLLDQLEFAENSASKVFFEKLIYKLANLIEDYKEQIRLKFKPD